MTRLRALALAVWALDRQIKDLAVLANMHDHYRANAPMCVEASKRRKLLREAIALLDQLAREDREQ